MAYRMIRRSGNEWAIHSHLQIICACDDCTSKSDTFRPGKFKEPNLFSWAQETGGMAEKLLLNRSTALNKTSKRNLP